MDFHSIVMPLSIEVTGIRQDEEVPREFTCDGTNQSPEMKIRGIPADAKSIVLIMEDPDAPVGLFVHWVLYNIGPGTTVIKSGMEKSINTSEGFVQGKNDFDRIGYDGPCPPKGHGYHRYFFKLYALDSKIEIAEPVTRDKVLKAIDGKILEQTEIMGKYKR